MKNSKKYGFTLMELLISISLIIILLGVMIPAIKKIQEAGKKTMAEGESAALQSAIKSYHTRYGMYPVEKDSDEADDTFDLKNCNGSDYYSKTDDEVLDPEDGWALLGNIAAKNDDGVFLLELENYREGDDGEVLDPYGNPYMFLMDMHDNDTNKNSSANGDEFIADGFIQVSNTDNKSDNEFDGRSGTYRIKGSLIKKPNGDNTKIRVLDAKGGIRVLFFTSADMEEIKP